MLLVKNCNLIDMAGIWQQPRDVLIDDDGLFSRIEPDIAAQPGWEVIDAGGCLVTPGLVESHCHIGMSTTQESHTNEGTGPVQPQLRGIDAVDMDSPAFKNALRTGVTTVATGPGSLNLIGGTFAVIKTAGDSVQGRVVCPELSMKMALGENPVLGYGRKGKPPATRMAAAAMTRDALAKARAYREKWLAHLAKVENGEESAFAFDAGMHSLMRVFDGMRVKIHAHQANDILTAIRIAQEFDLKLSIEHCTDGLPILDEIKASGARVIVGPTMGGKSKLELKNKEMDTQAKYEQAGLEFAITTDAGVIPIECLLAQLCVLVKHGLSRRGALAGVTINAARAMDMEARVGSIEPKKDGDLVIWHADPLTTEGEPQLVIIDGKVRYRREEGSLC